jgi:hypothetical protein
VVRSGLPEPVGGGFGVIPKALFALSKCFLSPLAVFDVGGRPVPFDNIARLIAQRLGLEQKPAIFTVEAPEPGLKPASRTGRPNCAPLHQHPLLVVGMESARPAKLGLVQREAGIVEGWLIEEIGDPLRSGAPNQRRDGVDDKSKVIFGFLDLVRRLLRRVLCSVTPITVISVTPMQTAHLRYQK